MTDPTPDATSPFERACIARWNGRALPGMQGVPWQDLPEHVRAEERRGFAAGLRELRDLSGTMKTAGHSKGVAANGLWQDISQPMALRLQEKYLPAAWQATLDAILKDAPK